MISLFEKKAIDYFSAEEKEKIKKAIEAAEKLTSGEIRVFVEHYCHQHDPMERAVEIFHNLKMDKTSNHNATLIYVALKHRKLAIYGDAGIHEKVGNAFWEETLKKMQEHFKNESYTGGIVYAIQLIGAELARFYPYDPASDKNDLPDELVF
jgi:uncharacterized membrane protein